MKKGDMASYMYYANKAMTSILSRGNAISRRKKIGDYRPVFSAADKLSCAISVIILIISIGVVVKR